MNSLFSNFFQFHMCRMHLILCIVYVRVLCSCLFLGIVLLINVTIFQRVQRKFMQKFLTKDDFINISCGGWGQPF